MGDAQQPQAPMSREQKIAVIARACHEANRSWCADHGDASQEPWFAAEHWQRQSAIAGVEFALKGEGPEAQHKAWAEQKLLEGWRYGPKKSAETKEHPCLVPYDQLSPMQQVKDGLFIAIVRALAPALGLMGSVAGWRPFNGEDIAEGERTTFFGEGARPEGVVEDTRWEGTD